MYWNAFPRNVLTFVVKERLPVWPTLGLNPTHERLEDVFVARADVPEDVLQALAALGLDIIRPPAYLVALLQATCPHLTRIVTPRVVGDELRVRVRQMFIAPNLT